MHFANALISKPVLLARCSAQPVTPRHLSSLSSLLLSVKTLLVHIDQSYVPPASCVVHSFSQCNSSSSASTTCQTYTVSDRGWRSFAQNSHNKHLDCFNTFVFIDYIFQFLLYSILLLLKLYVSCIKQMTLVMFRPGKSEIRPLC